MKIDSHHHFWNYNPSEYAWINDPVLKKDFSPKELEPEVSHFGINGVVSVQARQSLEETHWLLQIAEKSELVQAVVGWVPLADSAALDATFEELHEYSYLKAVRHVIQDEPDDAFILGKDFNLGISKLRSLDLVYDILIFGKHLQNTIKFVDQHPEQPFVLDHIAKPTILANGFDTTWARDFKELAKRPNVCCKFSGVATEVRDPTWTVDLIRPYWETAIEAFGTKRLMYGSDWPVCLLKTPYARWVETVEQLAQKLSDSEQKDFWGLNAQKAYRIE